MEDDYMSDDFLVAAEAAKTAGLATTATGKRLLKMERMRSDNEEIHKKKPKREEIEKERREEALSKPVCESTKGFAMLAKMGYKPGMSLGKKKDENDLGSGIKEPLPLEVRMGRKGFGHDYDLVQKRRQMTTRIKAEMSKMKNDADRHDEILEDFRRRKKNNTVTKKLISDIVNCRKTCMDLDVRQGSNRPQKPWFWKSYAQKEDDSAGPSHKDPDDLVWTYGNGELAEKEERLDEMTEEELTDRLLEIIDYLRSRHLYCIWCGHVYSSPDDLSTNCSGPLSEDHDDQDF